MSKVDRDSLLFGNISKPEVDYLLDVDVVVVALDNLDLNVRV